LIIRPDRFRIIGKAIALQKLYVPPKFVASTIPLLRLQPDEQIIVDHPGIVHQDADRTEFFLDLLDARLDCGQVGHVALIRTCCAAGLGHFLHESVGSLLVASVNDGRLSTLGGEGLDDASTDSPAASGDDGNLVLEPHGVLPHEPPTGDRPA